MKKYFWFGLVLLLGSRLVPAPLRGWALLLAGALLSYAGWTSNKGWARWWPLCTGSSALIAFAVFDSLREPSELVRNIWASLVLACLLAGPIPALVGFAREVCRSVAAGLDAFKVVRELRKQSTNVLE